jgi:hypothetical protein
VTASRREAELNALSAARRRGFEPRDASPRGVVLAALGLFAGIALSGVFVAGLLALFDRERMRIPATPLETARQVPPEPRLEISPGASRLAIEAAARQRLAGYAWNGPQKQSARIPIGRAMDLLARRGWPDAGEGEAPSQ